MQPNAPQKNNFPGVVRPSENPFRSAAVDALRYQPEPETLGQIAARFGAMGFRGALIGPHGHGKSTLMRELAKIDPPGDADSHPVVQIAADLSNIHALRSHLRHLPGVLMVDGYDLLPPRWRFAVWKRKTVLITAHRPTRVPTLLRCESSPALLARLIGRLSPDIGAGLGGAEVDRLLRAHRGNVRDALRELYDRVADGRLRIG